MRTASHSGSWYSSDSSQLASQLDTWLGGPPTAARDAKAVIVPHAGYRFSGRTAGKAFARLKTDGIRTVYVLGPSHHVYLDGACALSKAEWLQTPLGNLKVDTEQVGMLSKLPGFSKWNMDQDQDEHSLEMQFPFIYRIFELAGHSSPQDFSVVPIAVGSLSQSQEDKFAEVFAERFADPHSVFVISSDFCHWGSRFRYQFLMDANIPIYKSIESMDRLGMNLIERKDRIGFAKYLKETKNTICGRHPIALFLGILGWVNVSDGEYNLTFVHYEQSSNCVAMDDSSVSYAAAAVVLVVTSL